MPSVTLHPNSLCPVSMYAFCEQIVHTLECVAEEQASFGTYYFVIIASFN